MIYGIHGQSSGLLGSSDENLIEAFSTVLHSKHINQIITEKRIRIDEVIPQTIEIGRHQYKIENEIEIMKAVENSNFLLLAFCYTSFNELNSIFRSKGYYAYMTLDLEYSKFLGDGKMIQMDSTQKQVLDHYTKYHPKTVLIQGDYGSGKTIILTQMVSIRISQIESDENMNNKKLNVIVAIDVESLNSKLLGDYKTKNLGFSPLDYFT